ncbi:RNA polymerase sigma-70 factor [Spirosoma sp. HMF4905]|uniref:RNA polymerase sigma-70 factor n=1 Tax=Spirosoma arboris TaxID=2682092 RepID=A0A7K1SH73_9BACT|nr:RNA polymerase sigma-70 factor [Spirosoma arboris]MVM33160.1 RNA polymerase sigma-70 factor [Spirosoma arboris]
MAQLDASTSGESLQEHVSLPLPDQQMDLASLTMNDELFIRRAMVNDPEKGVELLYRRYFQPLCSHAIKYVGSKAVAEDLVSEVFYEFYKTSAFLEVRYSYRYYLFRSVRNSAFSYIKWELKRTEHFEDAHEAAFPTEQSPETISQFEEMYQDVQNAVNSLPFERRKIYLMNRFEGKRYQEIADELTISVKTVEVQLYRANKYIRTLLRNKWLLSIFFCLSTSFPH